MPETPVTSDDQKASRSCPIGGTTPAATTVTRSGAAMERAPGVEEVEPLRGIRANHALQRGDYAAEPPQLLAGLHPAGSGDRGPVAAARGHRAERGDHRGARGPRENERAQRERGRLAEERHERVAAPAGGEGGPEG